MQLTSTQRKAIDHYYNELEAYHTHKVTHETAVRSAFQNLLAAFAQSAITTRVALMYTASIVGLAAQQAGRPDLIRSRHSHARLYVGGLLNDEMRSRNLSERLYFFQPML